MSKKSLYFLYFVLTLYHFECDKIDRHHYKNFYLKKINTENTNRKGNIWNSPYYELQKKNHENDQRIHREVLRENQQHNNEARRQYDESVHESQETHRMQDETRRENSVKQAEKTQKNFLGGKRKQGKKKKSRVLKNRQQRNDIYSDIYVGSFHSNLRI